MPPGENDQQDLIAPWATPFDRLLIDVSHGWADEANRRFQQKRDAPSPPPRPPFFLREMHEENGVGNDESAFPQPLSQTPENLPEQQAEALIQGEGVLPEEPEASLPGENLRLTSETSFLNIFTDEQRVGFKADRTYYLRLFLCFLGLPWDESQVVFPEDEAGCVIRLFYVLMCQIDRVRRLVLVSTKVKFEITIEQVFLLALKQGIRRGVLRTDEAFIRDLAVSALNAKSSKAFSILHKALSSCQGNLPSTLEGEGKTVTQAGYAPYLTDGSFLGLWLLSGRSRYLLEKHLPRFLGFPDKVPLVLNNASDSSRKNVKEEKQKLVQHVLQHGSYKHVAFLLTQLLKCRVLPEAQQQLIQYIIQRGVYEHIELLLIELLKYQAQPEAQQQLIHYILIHGSHERIQFLFAKLVEHKAKQSILHCDALFQSVVRRNDPKIMRFLLKHVSSEQAKKWAAAYMENEFKYHEMNDPALLKVLWPYLLLSQHRIAARKAYQAAFRMDSQRDARKRRWSAARLCFRLAVSAVIGFYVLAKTGALACYAWCLGYDHFLENLKQKFSRNVLLQRDEAWFRQVYSAREQVYHAAKIQGYQHAFRVSVPVRGATLDALKLIRSEAAIAPNQEKWVVYFTRLGESMPDELARNLDHFAKRFPNSHILACDYRHMGERPTGVWSPNAWKDDVEGAVYHLLNQGVSAEHIEIVGDCLGGAVGAVAAASLHRAGHPVRYIGVRTPASFSGFLSNFWPVKMFNRAWMRLLGWELNARKAYQSLPHADRKHVNVQGDDISTLNARLKAAQAASQASPYRVQNNELLGAQYEGCSESQDARNLHTLAMGSLDPKVSVRFTDQPPGVSRVPLGDQHNLASFFQQKRGFGLQASEGCSRYSAGLSR